MSILFIKFPLKSLLVKSEKLHLSEPLVHTCLMQKIDVAVIGFRHHILSRNQRLFTYDGSMVASMQHRIDSC